MPAPLPVDPARCVLDIHRDLAMNARQRRPGPPERVDGVTIGIVVVEGESPHDGEVHPDGDELLLVISGRVRVTCDSASDEPLEIEAGGACIVPRGEWHRVEAL